MNAEKQSKLPLFSTAYFPPISMMGVIIRHKEILIEQKESFPKQTHRNRTVINTSSGTMTLSVPLLRPEGSHTPTEKIGISYAERWNILHLRSIETAYNSSPFFLYYRDDIETILLKHYNRLVDLNQAIIDFIFKKLKIDCTIYYTSDYIKPGNASLDFREKFNYKHPDKEVICPNYYQVFSDRMPFNSNVGILDTIFNLGPETSDYLQKILI